MKPKGKDDKDGDDGESLFMPLDEVLRKLKAGPLNFGVYLTGNKDEPVLLAAHKRRAADVLGKKAKKEAGTVKGAFGVLTLDAEALVFQCANDDPPASLKKRIRVVLKNAGYAKFKPRILLPGGGELSGEDDDEEDGGAPEAVAIGGEGTAGAPAAAGRPAIPEAGAGSAPDGSGNDALRDEVMALWESEGPLLQIIAETADGKDAAQAGKLIKLMEMTLKAGDYAKAKGALTVVERFTGSVLARMGGEGGGAGGPSSGTGGAAPQATPQATQQPAPQSAPQSAAMGGAKGGDGASGGTPAKAAENARLAEMTPEQLAGADLTTGDLDRVFSEDYMMALKDAPIKGQGDPGLKTLMREIDVGVSGQRRDEVMAALSRIVGTPPTAEDLGADYDRFVIVRKQQMVKNNKAVERLDETKHPDFMGSRSQLMFGKVLGDAFGIHEVFACLLSPTGGLVGPGNDLIPGVIESPHLDPDNPVALHGTVHDAAGYLLSYHKDGPGYNYRHADWEPLGTDSCLSGQLSGIAFWVEKTGGEYLEKRLGPIRDAVAEEIDEKIAAGKLTVKQAAAKAKAFVAETEAKVVAVGEAVEEALEELEDAAEEAIDSGVKAIGAAADGVRKDLKAAWNFIWD